MCRVVGCLPRAEIASEQHRSDQIGAIERDLAEELQARDGGVAGDRRGTAVDHLHLEAPQIRLSAGGVG